MEVLQYLKVWQNKVINMPWSVKKVGDKFKIIKKTTGQVVGTSNSKAMADASVRARYAATNGK